MRSTITPGFVRSMEIHTNMEWEKLIEFYFEMGLKYSEIKTVLSSRHGFEISERHLKRFLSERGLSQRKDYSDLAVFG